METEMTNDKNTQNKKNYGFAYTIAGLVGGLALIVYSNGVVKQKENMANINHVIYSQTLADLHSISGQMEKLSVNNKRDDLSNLLLADSKYLNDAINVLEKDVAAICESNQYRSYGANSKKSVGLKILGGILIIGGMAAGMYSSRNSRKEEKFSSENNIDYLA